jgi:hypothetical protein
MTEYILIYNPEDVQLDRIHNFMDPITTQGNEIIAKLTTNQSDDLLDWLREWTYETRIVAAITNIEDPSRFYRFEDIYPNSDICKIIEKESPGGDIRKYTSDIYGGVNESITFDVCRSQKVEYITGFEPLSMHSTEFFVEKSIFETHQGPDLSYPTGKEILEWAEKVKNKFPQTYCGTIGSIHFRNDEITGGCTGFIIYNVDKEILEWAEKVWMEEEETNMKYSPSEFNKQSVDNSPTNSNYIRMWWD